MQDGATAHTGRTTMQLLQRQRVPVLLWPSKSPDLNPIENVYMCGGGACSENLCRAAKKALGVLRDGIMTEWNRIPQRFVRNFILYMRQRCQAVI